MKTSVVLHGTGRWSDEIGRRYNKEATDAVNNFNSAALKFENAIKKVDSYSEDDINYESQKDKIYSMRIEFNG